jgi:hypothetical protein
MSQNADVARRLLDFVAEARTKASGPRLSAPGFQRQVDQPRSSPDTLEEICEKCLAELTDEERDALDRMIEKMRRATVLASPPGAVVPP